MSQRQFLRRGDMEVSAPGFQRESATPQAIGDEIQSSRSNSQRQELEPLRGGEGFQGELLNSAAAAAVLNRRFSLQEILREALYLARARRKFVLIFLLIFTLGVLLLNGFSRYAAFREQQNDLDHSREARQLCLLDILYPWKAAAIKENLTSAQQEKFYTLFQEKCTKFFKLPAEDMGLYKFRNGTMTYESHGGFSRVLSHAHNWWGALGSLLLFGAWTVWGQVALTWGLHSASMRTMAYGPPSMRNKRPPSQTLKEVFRELFAFRVLQGVIRVIPTEAMIYFMFFSTRTTIFIVGAFVKHKSLKLHALLDMKSSVMSRWWDLADPAPFLFLLSTAASALEPGVWGLKALGRGFEMAKGNRLKSYLICSVLVLWNWLHSYVLETAFKKEQTETLHLSASLWRWMQEGTFLAMRFMPKYFIVSVFYFLCKSWREKVDTME